MSRSLQDRGWSLQRLRAAGFDALLEAEGETRSLRPAMVPQGLWETTGESELTGTEPGCTRDPAGWVAVDAYLPEVLPISA